MKNNRTLKASNLASKERTDFINQSLRRLDLKNEINNIQSKELNAYAMSRGITTGDPTNSFNKLEEMRDAETQKQLMRKNLYKIFGNRNDALEIVYGALMDDPDEVMYLNTYFPKILSTLNENVKSGYVKPELFLAFYQRFKTKMNRTFSIEDPIQDQMGVPLEKLNEGDSGNQLSSLMTFMNNTVDFTKYKYACIPLMEQLGVDVFGKSDLFSEAKFEKMMLGDFTFPPIWNVVLSYIFRSLIFIIQNENKPKVLKHNYFKLAKYLDKDEITADKLIDYKTSALDVVKDLMNNEIKTEMIIALKKEFNQNRLKSLDKRDEGDYDGEDYETIYEEDTNETKQNNLEEDNGDVENDAKDESITYDIQDFNEQLQMLINKHIQLKKQDDFIESQRKNFIRNKRIQNEDKEFFDKAKQLKFEQFKAALTRRAIIFDQILKLNQTLEDEEADDETGQNTYYEKYDAVGDLVQKYYKAFSKEPLPEFRSFDEMRDLEEKMYEKYIVNPTQREEMNEEGYGEEGYDELPMEAIGESKGDEQEGQEEVELEGQEEEGQEEAELKGQAKENGEDVLEQEMVPTSSKIDDLITVDGWGTITKQFGKGEHVPRPGAVKKFNLGSRGEAYYYVGEFTITSNMSGNKKGETVLYAALLSGIIDQTYRLSGYDADEKPTEKFETFRHSIFNDNIGRMPIRLYFIENKAGRTWASHHPEAAWHIREHLRKLDDELKKSKKTNPNFQISKAEREIQAMINPPSRIDDRIVKIDERIVKPPKQQNLIIDDSDAATIVPTTYSAESSITQDESTRDMYAQPTDQVDEEVTNPNLDKQSAQELEALQQQGLPATDEGGSILHSRRHVVKQNQIQKSHNRNYIMRGLQRR